MVAVVDQLATMFSHDQRKHELKKELPRGGASGRLSGASVQREDGDRALVLDHMSSAVRRTVPERTGLAADVVLPVERTSLPVRRIGSLFPTALRCWDRDPLYYVTSASLPRASRRRPTIVFLPETGRVVPSHGSTEGRARVGTITTRWSVMTRSITHRSPICWPNLTTPRDGPRAMSYLFRGRREFIIQERVPVAHRIVADTPS